MHGDDASPVHRRLNSPGQAAQEWMQAQSELPKRTDLATVVPWQALDDARGTYYGGWFEIFMHGIVPGTSYEYDINSAYPHIIRNLPCLLHGKWEYRNRDGITKRVKAGPVPEIGGQTRRNLYKRRGAPAVIATELPQLEPGQIRFVRGIVQGSDPCIGAMLHRFIDDSIARPDCTRGWFWQHELEASARAGLIDSGEYEEWWTYTPCGCRPPLRGLAGLYDQRLRVGKNTSQGKACKLIYNSVYGKNAQSIGEAKYGNMIYASLITAGCRTMILDAIATHPGGTSAVAMIATDGVYFTSAHPGLPISATELGCWDVSEKENLTLFKPGVYWDDKARAAIRDGGKPQFKARGVNASAFSRAIDEIDGKYAAWGGEYPENDDDWPSVNFDLGFDMTSCQQALQRGKWDTAGKVRSNVDRTQNSIPSGKRAAGYYDQESGVYRSRPVSGKDRSGKADTSKAYAKGSVIRDPELRDTATPDGYGNMLVSEALRG